MMSSLCLCPLVLLLLGFRSFELRPSLEIFFPIHAVGSFVKKIPFIDVNQCDVVPQVAPIRWFY